jgi:hypothetical protein
MTMADEKSTTPAPETEAKPKRTRSDQDQVIADAIVADRQALDTVRDDSQLAAMMAARGYDAAKLSEGVALQEAAQTAFSARQQAIGAQKGASDKRYETENRARETYREFRATARTIFKDDATLSALGLAAKIPFDTQKFAAAAAAGYRTALGTPDSLAELGKYGFGKPMIESGLAAIEEMIAADNAHEAAKAEAVRATKHRDATSAALKAWMSQFRGMAKIATRSRPDLAKKLGI